MEFETKDDLLAFLNAVVWALRTLEAADSLPAKEEVKTKFPQISPDSIFSAISAYCGTLNKEELKGKVGQVLAEVEALRDTFLDPSNTPGEIRRVPKEVLRLPQFKDQDKEKVKSVLQSYFERLKRGSEEEFLEEEEDFPLFTFTSNSHVSPLYDEAAKIFLREDLVDSAGIPKDDYRIKLGDNKFKKNLEEELSKAISERHLTEQIAQEIDLAYDDRGISQDELDLGKRLIAEEATEKIGNDPKKLAGLKSALSKHQERETKKMQAFFGDLLVQNQKIPKEERERIAREATEACFSVLFSFELTLSYEVQVNPDSPSFTLITTNLETKKKLYEDFVIAPKTVEDFERDYEREKRDFEILFGAHMAKLPAE